MKKITPIHPLLFSIFPLLSLYAANRDLVNMSVIVAPLVLILAFSLGLLLVFKGLVGSFIKAAMMVSVLSLFFFSYAAFSNFAERILSFLHDGVVVSLIFLLWALLLLVVVYMIWISTSQLIKLTKTLNFVSIVLVSMPIYTTFFLGTGPNMLATDSVGCELEYLENCNLGLKNNKDGLPDVYLIVLDGHARQDVLMDMFGSDNSEFINGLREMDFYVADGAESNYTQTYLSLASMLNMDYLENLGVDVGSDSDNRSQLARLIENSRVFSYFRDKEYSVFHFASGWSGSDELGGFDVKFKPSGVSLSEFHSVFLNTTPLSVVGSGKGLLALSYNSHRNIITKTIKYLPKVSLLAGPTFSYVHLMSPHPPFVFDRYGQERHIQEPFGFNDPTWKEQGDRTKNDYIQQYKDQLSYVDGEVLKMLRDILVSSEVSPIVILMSDHGPASTYSYSQITSEGLKERLSILYAVYLPKSEYDDFSNNISLVNSFRMILKSEFGESYTKLPDKNYYSLWDTPYLLKEVADVID